MSVAPVIPLDAHRRTPQAAPDPFLLPAARSLAADGVTPLQAWQWDANWADPDLRDPAVLNLAEAVAWVQGARSPLEEHLEFAAAVRTARALREHAEGGCAAILAASGPS
jgi:hypothetical protein